MNQIKRYRMYSWYLWAAIYKAFKAGNRHHSYRMDVDMRTGLCTLVIKVIKESSIPSASHITQRMALSRAGRGCEASTNLGANHEQSYIMEKPCR